MVTRRAVVTRRALLGAGLAGGAALLTGCGQEDESAVKPPDVLAAQLRVSQVAVVAYQGLDATVDVAARPVVERLAERASSRERRLESALRAAGGTPGPPPGAPVTPGLEAALAAEQQALRAHVEGIGLLGEREFRALFADLVAEAAQHESALLTLLDRPAAPTAFPGQPT